MNVKPERPTSNMAPITVDEEQLVVISEAWQETGSTAELTTEELLNLSKNRVLVKRHEP